MSIGEEFGFEMTEHLKGLEETALTGGVFPDRETMESAARGWIQDCRKSYVQQEHSEPPAKEVARFYNIFLGAEIDCNKNGAEIDIEAVKSAIEEILEK